jgi:hypothetical protein
MVNSPFYINRQELKWSVGMNVLFRAGIFVYVFVLFTDLMCANASEVRQAFKSPAFNGQGYSSHVLTIENLTFQREKDIKAKEDAQAAQAARDAANTNVNKFLANVESRIYAELSKQISDKLFGENPQSSGSMVLLGNTIDYTVTDSIVNVSVRAADGTTTVLNIPVGQFKF